MKFLTEKKFDEIKERLDMLDALEGAGVDNWGGMEHAQEMMEDFKMESIPPVFSDSEKIEEAFDRVGRWLSAALDDENVCDEMKSDITALFELVFDEKGGWK